MKPLRHTLNVPSPYRGQDVDRRAHLGQPYERPGYGHDGRRTYRFNRLGFRSPEFDPQAQYRIFAFGESHAFGYFVEAEDSWPARFASLWAESHGLAPDAVCFQNFADVGASNGHIARSVITQCSAVQPDLVLVHFGEHRRSEVFLDGEPHRIGPWLLDEATARAAPLEEPMRGHYLQQIERARHYYAFALGRRELGDDDYHVSRDATCLEDTLRNVLLVQYFCRARGIPAMATCDLVDALYNDGVRGHGSLGPLLAQIDPEFLTRLRIWSVEGDQAEDQGHAGAARHERFARVLLGIHRDGGGGLDLSAAPHRAIPAAPVDGAAVRSFYDELPFNHWGDLSAAVDSVVAPGALDAYPDLKGLFQNKTVRRVVECGCGGGWLATTLAVHHGVEVTAIDFSSHALTRARELAATLGVEDRVRCFERDLTTLELDEPFDLMVSLGVLHHTADPEGTCRQVCKTVGDGGFVYLGLYHEPGRKVFLERLRSLVAARGEDHAFETFRHLARDLSDDEVHLRSWFRDQVLHPLESQHTLRQVSGWLDRAGFEILSTSINRFAPFDRLEDVWALESAYEERARQALDGGRFFPGFFTVLARRSS